MEEQQPASAGQSRLSSYRDLTAGTIVFEKFEILERVGEGGMGVVYKARDQRLNRFVALKVVSSDFLSDRDMVRFQNEARALSRLDHPNTATVFDFDVVDGRTPYLSMEFVEGRTLEDLLEERKKLTVPEVVEIFTQVCYGLKHAHSKNVIHRDLKTGNIMLTADAAGELRVVLVDFGVAKIDTGDERHRVTTTGVFVGSPLYISPEQIDGRPADARSDIYSLGGIMFHSLTGDPPFRGESTMETLAMHKNSPPPLAVLTGDDAIPEDLIGLIGSALAKSPDERPGSIDEVLESFNMISESMPKEQPASPKSSMEHTVSLLTSQTLSDSTRLSMLQRSLRVVAVLILLGAGAVFALAAFMPSTFDRIFHTKIGGKESTSKPVFDLNHRLSKPVDRYLEDGIFEDETAKVMNKTLTDVDQSLGRKKKTALFEKMFVDAHVLVEPKNRNPENLKKAYELFKKCYAMQISDEPVRKENMVETLICLASLARDLKKNREFDDYLKVASEKSACPKDCKRVGEYCYLIAMENQFAGQQKTAVTLFRKAITLLENSSNEGVETLALAQNGMSCSVMALGDLNQSLQFGRASRQTSRKNNLTDRVTYINTLIHLGHSERLAGNTAKALAIYNEGLAVSKKYKGRIHPDILADLYCGLSQLNITQGDLGEARRWAELALKTNTPQNKSGTKAIHALIDGIKALQDAKNAQKAVPAGQ